MHPQTMQASKTPFEIFDGSGLHIAGEVSKIPDPSSSSIDTRFGKPFSLSRKDSAALNPILPVSVEELGRENTASIECSMR